MWRAVLVFLEHVLHKLEVRRATWLQGDERVSLNESTLSLTVSHNNCQRSESTNWGTGAVIFHSSLLTNHPLSHFSPWLNQRPTQSFFCSSFPEDKAVSVYTHKIFAPRKCFIYLVCKGLYSCLVHLKQRSGTDGVLKEKMARFVKLNVITGVESSVFI